MNQTLSTPLYNTIHPLQRALITLMIMSATLMQVIDTTIVNVALPHIQGSLNASSDEITWTLTSYLVSSAIFMPLTGYFADRLGRKKFLIISIAGFTLVSALCGASVTLSELIFFRLLQGMFGASLVPLSQAVLTDIYPPKDRGRAMSIWGVGVMVGPIIGPSLGGYLTDIASWRWTFYVNVPVGVFALLLSNVIPNTIAKKREMDWLGLGLISIAIGSLQYILDRGNQADWFASKEICLGTYITLASFLGFLLHNLNRKKATVFDISIFRDRNFAISGLILCIFGLGLYGMMVIQPMMMEGLFSYPALATGLMMAPRGISSMLSMLLVVKLITIIDPRRLIISGVLISAAGLFASTHYSLNAISPFWLIWPTLLQGFGMGMILVPLSTIAFSTLPVEVRTESAGLFSLLRTMGGSIGISITVTLITRYSQRFWNQLSGFIQPYNTAVYQYLVPMHMEASKPLGAMLLAREIGRQAQMLSFINVLAFIMWSFLLMIPLVLCLKKSSTQTS